MIWNRSAFLFFICLSNCLFTFSNDRIRCSTQEIFLRNANENPNLILQKQQALSFIKQYIENNKNHRNTDIQAVVTIPVVVHVVYKNSAENISDAQIQTQLDVLNKDFRNLNADKLASTHAFFSLAQDAQIEFCLASIDPNGNTTTGITRTATSVNAFTDDDKVKFDSDGGKNAWNAKQYLNIWVCNLGNLILGYATLPEDLVSNLSIDGVVINYDAFGTIGTAAAPYNKGRTTTHEIGHWLGLEHIWGDDNDCSGTDHVDDTPNQEVETTTCPAGIVTDACNPTAPGIMYQNYMDYTDDACMVMFTNGQVERMQAALNLYRTDLFSSSKCSGTTNVSVAQNSNIKIYPNPVQNYLAIEGLPKNVDKNFYVELYNTLGQIMYVSSITAQSTLLEMPTLNAGTYIIRIYNAAFNYTQKLTFVSSVN